MTSATIALAIPEVVHNVFREDFWLPLNYKSDSDNIYEEQRQYLSIASKQWPYRIVNRLFASVIQDCKWKRCHILEIGRGATKREKIQARADRVQALYHRPECDQTARTLYWPSLREITIEPNSHGSQWSSIASVFRSAPKRSNDGDEKKDTVQINSSNEVGIQSLTLGPSLHSQRTGSSSNGLPRLRRLRIRISDRMSPPEDLMETLSQCSSLRSLTLTFVGQESSHQIGFEPQKIKRVIEQHANAFKSIEILDIPSLPSDSIPLLVPQMTHLVSLDFKTSPAHGSFVDHLKDISSLTNLRRLQCLTDRNHTAATRCALRAWKTQFGHLRALTRLEYLRIDLCMMCKESCPVDQHLDDKALVEVTRAMPALESLNLYTFSFFTENVLRDLSRHNWHLKTLGLRLSSHDTFDIHRLASTHTTLSLPELSRLFIRCASRSTAAPPALHSEPQHNRDDLPETSLEAARKVVDFLRKAAPKLRNLSFRSRDPDEGNVDKSINEFFQQSINTG